MRQFIRRESPHRRLQTIRKIARPTFAPRIVARAPPAIPSRRPAEPIARDFTLSFLPDPYVDYGRFLTPEGGILILYKDIDQRFRHTLWRVFAWTASSGIEGWYLFHHSPVHAAWINLICFIVVAIINWLIVAKPVELYRSVEIRPDCLILDGTDIFWARYMEGGFPTFRPDEEGNQVLCGAYGTRFVEYLTARRLDEFDRQPEVFASHLQNAMRQLWTWPH